MKRSGMRRRTALQARTGRLPAVSARRVSRTVERAELLARVLAANPVCQRCRQAATTDVHELVRRSQARDAIYDETVCVGLCRPCHMWVTAHPAQAVADGWAIWGWQYRQQEGDVDATEN